MFINLVKSIAFKPIVALILLAMLTMSFTTPQGVVMLKAGTVVPLELMSSINNKVSKGAMVNFRVISDIKTSGEVVIPAGSIAQGQVTRVKKNGLLGTEGEVEVAIRKVNAVDGTVVLLSGGTLNDEGNSKMVVSIVFTILCIFGFLIKGGKAEIPAGSTCEAIVSTNTEISIN